MTSNVTAVLIVLIVSVACVALTWLAKGTDLFDGALLGSLVLIPFSVGIGFRVAQFEDA